MVEKTGPSPRKPRVLSKSTTKKSKGKHLDNILPALQLSRPEAGISDHDRWPARIAFKI